MRQAALSAAAGLLWGLHLPLRWLARLTGHGAIALAQRAEALRQQGGEDRMRGG